MKNKLILLFAILLGLTIIIFVILQFANQTKTNNQIQENSNINVSYQTQTDEKGSVVAEATPILLKSGGNASFIVKFTTHSVDLNYDIAAIAKLTDDKDNVYKPLSWTGGSDGHHIEGELTFPKLSQDASSVKLTIPGIDNQDRIFEWKLD